MTLQSGLLGFPAPISGDTRTDIFSTAGTHTWVKPAGARWVQVTCVGAGCGGGSGAKGGTFDSVKTYLDGTGLVMRGVNGQNATNNSASIPDNAAHRPTGDFELIAKLSMDDWSPSSVRGIIWNGTGSTGAALNYYLYVDIVGRLVLSRPTGTTARAYQSSALGLADGSTKWLRVVFDADNGAGSSAATFYTSDNGITWTTINTATVANTTAGNSVVAPFRVGSDGSTTNILAGKVFKVKMISDPLGTPVTVVDIDFETQQPNILSFTESSSNQATVTISQAGVSRGGGGGGAGGQVSFAEYAADALPSSVAVSVGVGAGGGARVTASSTNGNNGGGGGDTTRTSFGIFCSTQSLNGGFGGQLNVAGGGGSINSLYSLIASGAGLAGALTSGATQPAPGAYTGGGGGGSGISTTDVNSVGGFGGVGLFRPAVTGLGSICIGGAGGSRLEGTTPPDGGNGIYGGGGGGGGAGINGVVDSGAGGKGGDGLCIVTTYVGSAIDIQDFSSSGTWERPTDPRLTFANVFVLGGGGGGGSGCLQPNTGSRCGGGAGGGGGQSIVTIPLSMLPDLVTVTVGSSGAGASAPVVDNTNGSNGSSGGTSSFGSYVLARGGGGGVGGTTVAGSAGGLTGRGSTFSGPAGGPGSQPTSDAGSGSGSLSFAGSGGGGGGWRGAGSTAGSGGGGGIPNFRYNGTFVAVNTSASDVSTGTGFFGGAGGGGGWTFSAATTPGGNGVRGGGGGGGAGNTNGTTAGSGGSGGNGRVVIVCR